MNAYVQGINLPAHNNAIASNNSLPLTRVAQTTRASYFDPGTSWGNQSGFPVYDGAAYLPAPAALIDFDTRIANSNMLNPYVNRSVPVSIANRYDQNAYPYVEYNLPAMPLLPVSDLPYNNAYNYPYNSYNIPYNNPYNMQYDSRYMLPYYNPIMCRSMVNQNGGTTRDADILCGPAIQDGAYANRLGSGFNPNLRHGAYANRWGRGFGAARF